MSSLEQKHCIPCEGNIRPFSQTKEDEMLTQVIGWELSRTGIHSISRKFKLQNFQKAMDFVNQIAFLAEKEQHHPNITIKYNIVELVLFTHAIKGLFDNDFILAAKINEIAKNLGI